MDKSIRQTNKFIKEMKENIQGIYRRIFKNKQNTPLQKIDQTKIHQFIQTINAIDIFQQINQENNEKLEQLDNSMKEYIQLNGQNMLNYQQAIKMLQYCLYKERGRVKQTKQRFNQINRYEQVQTKKKEDVEKQIVSSNQFINYDYQFDIELSKEIKEKYKEKAQKNQNKTLKYEEEPIKLRVNQPQQGVCIEKNQIQLKTQLYKKNKSLKQVFSISITTFESLLKLQTKPKQIIILTKTIKQLRKNQQQLKEIHNVNYSIIDFQKHKIQNRIRNLFNFYCKKHHFVGKGATFDSIKQQSQKMDIGSMVIFCNEYGVFSSQINRNLMVEKFKKVGENSKLISIKQFSNLLNQLAVSQFPESENSSEQFYNKLKLIKDEDYREKLKQLNIPICCEKGSFRKYQEKSKSIQSPFQTKKKTQFKLKNKNKEERNQKSEYHIDTQLNKLKKLNGKDMLLSLQKNQSNSNQQIKKIITKNKNNNYNFIGEREKDPELFKNLVINDEKDQILDKFQDLNEKKTQKQKHIITDLYKRANQEMIKQSLKQQNFLKKIKHK